MAPLGSFHQLIEPIGPNHNNLMQPFKKNKSNPYLKFNNMAKNIYMKLLVLTLFLSAAMQIEAKCDWYKMSLTWTYTVNGGTIAASNNLAKYPCVQSFWSLAGATAIKGNNITYKVTKNGIYKLCMKLYDTCNRCDTIICKEIKVDGIKSCNVDFVADITKDGVKFKPLFPCNGKAVYSWKFGNGTFGKTGDPFVKYAKGTYEVCLTAKCYTYDQINKRYDSCEAKICKKIVVKANPCELKGDFYFKVGDKNMITFVGYANEQNLLYYWTIDNMERKGRDFSLYLTPGTHKVCMTIYNPKTGCKTTVCKTIEIPQPKLECKVDFTAEITKDGVKFKPNFPCNGTATYYWKFGNGTFSNNFDPFVKYVKGKYEVCLYAKCKVYNKDKKAYDSCETKICKTIVVKENPCDLKGEFSYKIGANNLVTFIVTANQQNLLYEWTINGTTKKGRDFNMTLKPGTHKVCVTIYNPKTNCKITICKTITINNVERCLLPKGWGSSNVCTTFNFEGFKAVDSKGNVISNPCHQYSWDFGDKTTSSGRLIKHIYTKPGTYKVCMRVVDTCLKCDTSICREIVVKACCNSQINAEFTDSIKLGGIVKFVNKSTGGVYFKWLFGDNTSSYDKNISHTYAAAGSYKVCLIAFDSSKNCIDTFCKTIKVTIKRGGTEAMSITGTTMAQWNLYPNPSSDAVTISGFNFNNGDVIRIKDIAGKTVLEINIEKAVTETTLSLEHLVPGIYTIQCQSLAGNSVQSKLIKQ
jgi:PKD repeat protein